MSDHVISPAAELLGREILSRDPATGEVCVRFMARREFYNRSGIVHGGFIAAMLDSVTGIAVSPRVPEGSWAVTARLDVRFHKPAGAGPIYGRAHVVKQHILASPLLRVVEVEVELQLAARGNLVDRQVKILHGRNQLVR